MGMEYHDPEKMPIRPFGGNPCQKRHMKGYAASSSVGAPKARAER